MATGIKISQLEKASEQPGGLKDEALLIVAQRTNEKGNPYDNYSVKVSEVRPERILEQDIKNIVWKGSN